VSVAAPEQAARRSRGPDSPYVGLVPYGEDDSEFFFGRSHEAAIVAANLRSSRLTIVYGPSGVGKSSLLQAGVVHGLRREAPEHPFAVCVVRSWLGDPVATLLEAAREALQPLDGPSATPLETLRAWTEQAGTLLVVLDQFEEYFQYHQREESGDRLRGFAGLLAGIVNDPGLAVNVLLSIREDAWAKLDRFEGHVPLLFANYLRIDHLDAEAAGEAIEGPIAAWNRLLPAAAAPYDIEPALMTAVLAAARGGLAGDETAASDRIEAPFLQLVLERLWRDTVDAGEHELTLERLEALGGARRIVENHLNDALARLTPAQQDDASDCFRFLVSSSRTKIAHAAADLAEWTHRPEAALTAVLELLCTADAGRILRAVAPPADESQATRYELFHDVLVEPALVWRRLHEQERSRRAFRRRVMRVGGAALALVAVLAAFSVWALVERGSATRRLHFLQTFSAKLQRQNDELAAQTGTLRNEADAASSAPVEQDLVVLRATNQSLQKEVRGLTLTRARLDRRIGDLRGRNGRLAATIGRLNAGNRRLAARITRLDLRYQTQLVRLSELSELQALLRTDADVLRAESRALSRQIADAQETNDRLLPRARRLGYIPSPPTNTGGQSGGGLRESQSTDAEQFGIPEALALHDTLRRQIEALERQIAGELARRARLVDEATWLQKVNGLLSRQRDALRRENAQLAAALVSLEARNRELRDTVAEGRAENASLRAQATDRERRDRATTQTVAARQTTSSNLQDANNGRVQAIGGQQVELGDLQGYNRTLTAFLGSKTSGLVTASREPSRDAVLAGILAAEASLATPYDPDGAAHPSVYNALWLALNRLDPAAARDLITPVANPSGKLGTTTSKLLVQRICARAGRPLSEQEWRRFLGHAPYPPDTQACR
jgi:hypothetical protein